MYEAVEDPYCYPGSDVLRNLANLRSQAELEKFEKFKVAQRSDEPLPVGRLNYRHYRAIHRHLFRDVYRWAGRIRTVRIAKGGNLFCLPELIDENMRRVFEELAESRFLQDILPCTFSVEAAHFLAELNAIHPFREGNGRTQNVFLSMLADRAGHPLDLDRLNPLRFLRAIIESFDGKESPLAEEILKMMRSRGS
jgi:cell filamentation protein